MGIEENSTYLCAPYINPGWCGDIMLFQVCCIVPNEYVLHQVGLCIILDLSCQSNCYLGHTNLHVSRISFSLWCKLGMVTSMETMIIFEKVGQNSIFVRMVSMIPNQNMLIYMFLTISTNLAFIQHVLCTPTQPIIDCTSYSRRKFSVS